MNSKMYFAAALTLVLTACNKDNTPVTPADGTVAARIDTEINDTYTRASGTEWTADDCIGISTRPGTTTDYSNIPYKFNGSRFEPDGTTIYFQSPEPVTFDAYYPFASGTAPGIVSADTKAANQSAGNQPKIDFLFASGATARKDAPTVNFTGDNAFRHKMSQITLTFIEGADVTFGGNMLTAYSLTGLVMEGTFDTGSGEAAAKPDATTEELKIQLENVTAPGGQYTPRPVILFPQTVATGNIGLQVTVDDQTFHATLTLPQGATALAPGNNYTFPVTVKRSGLTVGGAEIKDWDPVAGDPVDAVM